MTIYKEFYNHILKQVQSYNLSKQVKHLININALLIFFIDKLVGEKRQKAKFSKY